MCIAPVGVILFFNLPGLWFLVFFFLQMFSGFALSSLLATYFTELFPTSFRSTAQSASQMMYVLGGMVGMGIEAVLFAANGSHWTSISIIVCAAFASPALMMAFLPETSGKELDDIAPEVGEGGVELSSLSGERRDSRSEEKNLI